MKTGDDIREYIMDQLVALVELKAAKYSDENWRTGIPGATLEGRIEMLSELLEWMNAD